MDRGTDGNKPQRQVTSVPSAPEQVGIVPEPLEGQVFGTPEGIDKPGEVSEGSFIPVEPKKYLSGGERAPWW